MHHHASKQFSLAGAKTTERLRGNDQICNWLHSTFNWKSCMEAFNNYHQHAEDNMEENDIEEQQIEESQLYQSIRMA